MKTFNEWLHFRESMNVYVSGHEYQLDFQDLDTIGNYLVKKVIYPIWDKLNPEIQEKIKKGGSLHHNIIAPDGDYYSKAKKNILNFYTAGWPPSLVTKIIEGIRYFLDEKNIKYGQFKDETSGMFQSKVFRIPILSIPKPETDTPPILNLSNANANLIFGSILGFDSEGEYGYELSPADLLIRIDKLSDDDLELHQRDPYSSQTKGGPLMIHGGLGNDQIKQRLSQLRQIANWALKHGYQGIHVS